MLFCIVTDSSKEALNQALGKVDGIEFRFDLFPKIDLPVIQQLIATLRSSHSLKILFTLRPERQGGEFRGTEEERLSLLKELCALRPDYVDLEYDIPAASFKEFADRFPHIQLICSFHDFVHMPNNLDHLLASITNPYAHIYKIAAMAHTSNDALTMIQFVKKHHQSKKLIGIAMGEVGAISRILGPVVGNYFDYASILQPSAPGQLSVETLETIYHYGKLNRDTAIYGLIGYPIDKSLGHKLHNTLFDKTHTNAVYVKMPVRPEELSSYIPLARQLPFKGLSVTMPLKEAILPFLDDLSPSAKAIGAVNTIAIDQGKWTGHNTDGIGALRAIEQKIPVKDKRFVIVGAGGAAKAIAYEAVQRGAHVTILNRTAAKAEHLAGIYHCRGGGFSLFPEVVREGYEIIVNTIPEGELIDDRWILPHTVAMDIVYVPQDTPFLQKAAKKGCTLVYGYEMFLAQAAEQQLIWLKRG